MPNLKTQRRTGHFCLGQPAPLPDKCLPTEADVYNAIVHKRQEFNLKSNTYSNSEITKTEIFKEVAKDIITLWVVKGNLPNLPEQTVVRKITEVCDNAKAILKIPQARRMKMLTDMESTEDAAESKYNKKEKVANFLHDLFDICSCECVTRESCKCPKDKKIHPREWEFLMDQRSDREKVTGEVDKEVTEKWKEAEEKKEADEEARCTEVRERRQAQLQDFFQCENDENHKVYSFHV